MTTLKKINERFERELKKHLDTFHKNTRLNNWEKIINPFVLKGGKRIRPIMFLISYLGFGGKLNSDIYQIAVALELLHHCALAHDDIIDKSARRRGKLSLPHRFQKSMLRTLPPNLTGTDYALLAGDLLYTYSLWLIHESKLERDMINKAMSLILNTAMITIIGQYAEMNFSHHPERIRRENIDFFYGYKSAEYTFCCPLKLGVILNSGANYILNYIDMVGFDFGYAYQIQDDLNDFWTEIDDGAINRITFPHFLLINEEKSENKKRISQILGNPPINAKDREWLKELFDAKRIKEQCEEEIFNRIMGGLILLDHEISMEFKYSRMIRHLLANLFPCFASVIV